MGKIKARLIGDLEIEQKQKEEQKRKAQEKKLKKKAEPKKVNEEENKKSEVKKLSALETKSALKNKKQGKKYQTAKAKIEAGKFYSLEEAVSLLKKINFTKFDSSVELHLNVDSVGLKGEVSLPYSIGKKLRVAILDDALLAEIEQGQINFDVLIAHPAFMPKLAKYARLLGPKGLMPNPKAGTVSSEPEKVAAKFAQGVIRWKTEAKYPLIHQLVAKLSADEKNIVANIKEFIKSVGKNHIKKAFIKSTMSPALKINLETV